MINQTLDLIKEQTGLNLKLCDHFIGIKHSNRGLYFNVILSTRISESKEYSILERFAKKFECIRVEPNGLDRVAIFPK